MLIAEKEIFRENYPVLSSEHLDIEQGRMYHDFVW